MAVLPIRLFPDPILRKPAQPVPPAREVRGFIERLVETMYAQPSGIGIAAPQVGESWRIIAMDLSPRDSSKSLEIMINPVIIRRSGEVTSREGCMSLPDYTANVRRSERVTVVWFDEKGSRRKRMFHGIEGMCVQHEIDHLEGKLILDRVACLKTDVLPRRRPA